MRLFFYLISMLSISILLRAQENGGNVDITAGDGDVAPGNVNIQAGGSPSIGGDVNIRSGGSGSYSGDINITTDDGNGPGDIAIKTGYSNSDAGQILISSQGSNVGEGGITLQTGNSNSFPSNINLTAGDAYYDGSSINLTAGDSNNDNGGYINLTPGNGSGGSDGLVKIWGSGCYTGSWTLCSDERFKKNIKNLEGSLNSVLQLRGVNFEFKTDEFPEKKFNDGKQIGLIAQEVEKVFPEFVETDAEGYKSVAYQNIVTVLIEAVKEQQKQIKNLNSRIEDLERGFIENAVEVSSLNK